MYFIIRYNSTNHALGSIDAQVIQENNKVRWFVEQIHRELKQLTGIEKCQCRKEHAQRNHIFFCYQPWFSLKIAANKLKTTVYQIKQNLWRDYLRN